MEDSGGDWDSNVEQLGAENERLRAAGGGAAVQVTVAPDEKDEDKGDDQQ